MSVKKFEVVHGTSPAVGTIVYKCAYHDYGLARDDTNHTGIEHISVTLKPDGDYPSFTIPHHYLKPL